MSEWLQPQLQLPPWASADRWERHQRPVFEEICARFDDGHRLVLVDAPCGSGKSLLGYMVHQYIGGRSLVLVGTKTLQDQYERTFPEIALIKGKANYIPLNVEHRTWRDPTCADCDLDYTGLCSYCDEPVDCPYTVARNYAADAPIACTNMAYALGEWTSPKSRFRGRDLVVLDEADTVADEILGHVSISISPRMQQRFGISPPARKTVESTWATWFEYVVPHMKAQRKRLPSNSLEDKRTLLRVDRLIDKLETVAENLEGWVYEYANDFIEFKPVTVHQLAPETLWRNGGRFLAMSASLGAPEAFIKDLGWEESYASVYAPSTFDKERRPIYFCPSAVMTKKNEAEAWPEMCRATQVSIEQHPDKNVLVHSHSYGLTRRLAESLENYDRPVFHYLNAEARKAAVIAFESTPGSVLIAPSLDRGYDNSNVDVGILCKVPSPYLGSKQVEKRLYETRDGKLWYANTTARAITQAYGRVMRAEDDEGVFIILDSMFSSFYARWRRLFPSWFQEAVHLDSPVRFELRKLVRELLLNVSSS